MSFKNPICWIHPETKTDRRKAVNDWVYVFCPCEECPMFMGFEEAERGPVQPVHEEIREGPWECYCNGDNQTR